MLFEVKELDSTDRSWHITKDFIRHLDASLPLLKFLEINRASLLALPNFVPSPFTAFDLGDEFAPHPNQFKNLRELTFGCFLEFQGIDCGFMSFQSDAVEVLRLSYFDYHINRFIGSVTQFTNLKILELDYQMELPRTLLNYDHSIDAVWKPKGIRELILHNSQITKIIVRPHPSEVDDVFFLDARGLEITYRDVIKQKLNGYQWKIDGDSKCLIFEKVMKK